MLRWALLLQQVWLGPFWIGMGDITPRTEADWEERRTMQMEGIEKKRGHTR